MVTGRWTSLRVAAGQRPTPETAPDSRREVLDSWPQRPPSPFAPFGLSLARAHKYVFFVSLLHIRARSSLRWRRRADHRFSGSGFSPRICRWLDTSRRMVGGPAVHFAAVKPVVHSFAPPCSPSLRPFLSFPRLCFSRPNPPSLCLYPPRPSHRSDREWL